MKIVCIGSCRLNPMKRENIFTDILQINLTHSTKDILQILKWGMEVLNIPNDISSFIFHSGMWSGSPVILKENIKKLINDADVFILEICSYKSYRFEKFYCHTDIFSSLFPHIPEYIYKNIEHIRDEKEDIEKDIDEIIELIGNRKIVVVTHILSRENDRLSDRKKLINDLTDICHKKKIPIIFPGEILEYNDMSKVVPDCDHYSQEGLVLIKQFYHKKINEILN